ncbi:MAG: hypothetical protein IJ792_05025 [Oscillospiraceae bacterium]|nr:hypothetical protein [Oscillospiraceae bacterium]
MTLRGATRLQAAALILNAITIFICCVAIALPEQIARLADPAVVWSTSEVAIPAVALFPGICSALFTLICLIMMTHCHSVFGSKAVVIVAVILLVGLAFFGLMLTGFYQSLFLNGDAGALEASAALDNAAYLLTSPFSFAAQVCSLISLGAFYGKGEARAA